jgi:hypothetical protein
MSRPANEAAATAARGGALSQKVSTSLPAVILLNVFQSLKLWSYATSAYVNTIQCPCHVVERMCARVGSMRASLEKTMGTDLPQDAGMHHKV